MAKAATILSLLDISVRNIASNFEIYEDKIDELPNPIKNKLLNLLTKRGIVTENILKNLLNTDTKRLELLHHNISDECFLQIKKCVNLKGLLFECDPNSGYQITDQCLMAVFPYLKYLQAIQLRRCRLLTDASIESLAVNCGRFLLYVNLSGCTNIGDRSLRHIAEHCPRLNSLSLRNTSVTSDGFFCLTNAPCVHTLKEISVDCCKDIDDEAIETLVMHCPILTILTFSGCPKLTEQSRQIIEEMQQAKSIKMKHISWTVY